MTAGKRTVLITGCSDGGLGAALAVALHKAGLHVYASARNPTKMENLAALGIETIQLDVQSPKSISECVSKISNLDILINNAGAVDSMPVVDQDIDRAKALFDLNVWSYIAVIQAFLPLLLKSQNGAMIVNNTSVAANVTIPFQGVYNASKAAIAMFTDTLRLELQAFNITVVDLRTGAVSSNIQQNLRETKHTVLPEDSIYAPAKEEVEKALRQEAFDSGLPATQWAESVVQNLLRKSGPSPVIWRGSSAWLVRLMVVFPLSVIDGIVKKMVGLDVVERILRR
ncbi:NAD(P)-binding protein [Polychaeton citri CBS 116435]|uniref:NAD(P)-binding protein n=1 Tax=Polychaeton citri CBS 116435 TaxID=1314669 RepID=A0A9P4UTE8_9PEZI|nr:NAD(P)-binding protein [Polychaeton citri CBS 116435]